MPVTCLRIPDFAAWAMSRRFASPGDGDSSPPSAHGAPSTGNGSTGNGLVVCAARRVYSCTPFLRRRGLAVGDSVERARSLVPEAEFLLRDIAIEGAILDSLLARLYTLTPQILPLGEHIRSTASPSSNAAWILLQGPDLEQLGQVADELPAQIGVGSRRCWAMLAAVHSDPGRLTSIPSGMIEPFLRQAPVSLLTEVGFSRDLSERLELFGLKAIAHTLFLTRRQLTAQFGPEGESLYIFLHPKNTEPPIPNYEPQVIEAEYDFEWPVFEPGDLLPVLQHLLEQLLSHLQGRSARHMEVRLRGRNHDRTRVSSRVLKNPTSQLPLLYNTAHTLLHQALSQNTSHSSSVPCGRGVETLTITLSGLTLPTPVQTMLFAEKPGVETLIDAARTRFPGKLQRPVLTHPTPFFPEEEYRFEPISR